MDNFFYKDSMIREYHHITVVFIAIADDLWEWDYDSIWYLNELMEPKHQVIKFHKESRDYLYEEQDYEIDAFDDCMIRIYDNQTIDWHPEED